MIMAMVPILVEWPPFIHNIQVHPLFFLQALQKQENTSFITGEAHPITP